MSNITSRRKLFFNTNGQTLMEMVIGLGLVTIVITALAVITTYSLRNSQFSKSQTQATKLAQESLEKVKTIRSSDYGVCFTSGPPGCIRWSQIWSPGDPGYPLISACGAAGCKFIFSANCTVAGQVKPLCLNENNTPMNLGNGFTGELTIQHESGFTSEKRVISRVSWTDNTGQHSSDLVTIFTRN